MSVRPVSDSAPATTWLAGLAVVWAMPALFLIAGLGSWYSLHRRGARDFATPILVKSAAIVAISFLVIFVVYDLAVRRTRATRLLFGIRD